MSNMKWGLWVTACPASMRAWGRAPEPTVKQLGRGPCPNNSIAWRDKWIPPAFLLYSLDYLVYFRPRKQYLK